MSGRVVTDGTEVSEARRKESKAQKGDQAPRPEVPASGIPDGVSEAQTGGLAGEPQTSGADLSRRKAAITAKETSEAEGHARANAGSTVGERLLVDGLHE